MTRELREFENICGVPTDPSYSWDKLVTNGETSDHEVANNFSNLLHPAKICDSEYISPTLIKVENLVCFYRLKFCHHILFRNQITPIHHFLFILKCFQTHIKHKIVAPVAAKSMSLQNRILHFTTRRESWWIHLTIAVFIHRCSSFKENIINVM